MLPVLWVLITVMKLQIAFAYEISFCTTLICPDLSEYNIKCSYFENHIDCLRSINRNETHLGYASPFESVVATQVLPNLELVGEVRSEANSSHWLYEIVLLTNKIVSNFDQLKNFSYCAPKIGSIPKFVVHKLERAILKSYKSQHCRNTSSFAEEHMCNLNEFFGPSCIATALNGRDTRKTEYIKLFQLCPEDTTQNGCTSGCPEDEFLHVQYGAMTITTLYHASTMWNPNLYYLCQNGSTSTKPCVWYRQPWPLIFTHKSLKQSITPKLNELLSICAVPGVQECLSTVGEILTATNEPHISVLNENETHEIIPILQTYKLDSSEYGNNKAIRWCTISYFENEKCNWIKAFSGTLIYPIECILRDSKASCISAIENSEADMVEIVKHPISDSLSPIALSTTPITFFKGEYLSMPILDNKESESTCTDKYYYLNSSMFRMPKSSNTSCPDGRYRQICTNGTNEVCHYLNEVIMRINNPNRENAKLLLDDLLIIFARIWKTRPFDFFEDFNGVSNWFFQDGKTELYFIYDTKELTLEKDDINYSPLRIRIIRLPGEWGTAGIVIGLLITIFCCVLPFFKNEMCNDTSIEEGYTAPTEQV